MLDKIGRAIVPIDIPGSIVQIRVKRPVLRPVVRIATNKARFRPFIPCVLGGKIPLASLRETSPP